MKNRFCIVSLVAYFFLLTGDVESMADDLGLMPSDQICEALSKNFELISARYESRYMRSKHMREEVENRGLVEIILSRNGKLIESRIVKKSSSSFADKLVIETIKELEVERKFIPLPACFDKESIRLEAGYGSSLRVRNPPLAGKKQFWGHLDVGFPENQEQYEKRLREEFQKKSEEEHAKYLEEQKRREEKRQAFVKAKFEESYKRQQEREREKKERAEEARQRQAEFEKEQKEVYRQITDKMIMPLDEIVIVNGLMGDTRVRIENLLSEAKISLLPNKDLKKGMYILRMKRLSKVTDGMIYLEYGFGLLSGDLESLRPAKIVFSSDDFTIYIQYYKKFSSRIPQNELYVQGIQQFINMVEETKRTGVLPPLLEASYSDKM